MGQRARVDGKITAFRDDLTKEKTALEIYSLTIRCCNNRLALRAFLSIPTK